MAAVILPAGLLSSVAPIVAKLQLRDLHETGTIVGRLSGIGTLGGIVATFAVGFVLVAAFATSTILIGTGVAVAAVGSADGRLRPAGRRPARGGAGPLPGAALALLPLSVLLVAVAPDPCQKETEYHCARVVADPDRPTGRTLELDTLRHSYVDLGDPEYLEFEYTRALAAVADSIRPPGAALQALHIGGGGFTMPRYLAANRPGTRSTVLEIDGGVVRARPRAARRGRRPGPDRPRRRRPHGPAGAAPGRYDLVVGDAFGGLAVPWHLTTRQVAEQIRDVLTDDGVYAVNVIDYPPDRFARAEIATLRIGLRPRRAARRAGHRGRAGRRQPLLVASRRPAADGRDPARPVRRGAWLVADEAATTRFAGDAAVLTDDHAPVDQLVTPSSRGPRDVHLVQLGAGRPAAACAGPAGRTWSSRAGPPGRRGRRGTRRTDWPGPTVRPSRPSTSTASRPLVGSISSSTGSPADRNTAAVERRVRRGRDDQQPLDRGARRSGRRPRSCTRSTRSGWRSRPRRPRTARRAGPRPVTSTAATGWPGHPDHGDVVERDRGRAVEVDLDRHPGLDRAAVRASISASAAGRSGTSTSARKPSRPRLTPSTGAPVRLGQPHAPAASCRRRPG